MLTQFADWLVFSIFGLIPGTHWGEAVHFFVYDMIKISLLLIVVTHLMGIIRHYLPVKKIRNFLSQNKLYGLEYFFATVFGIITPFCTCSSIPLFIGFLRAGIPLGVTLSFLVTSPLINEVAIVLFWSLFGWKVTLLYIVAGIGIGMVSGWFLGKMNLENQVEEFLNKPCGCKKNATPQKETRSDIARKVSKEAFEITKKVLPYLVIGIALGGWIHGFIPEGYFAKYLTQKEWWTVPFSVILAVPLYANASGVIPIVESLVDKGVPLGTALSFMMAVVGLSLPEAMILKRVMKPKLLLSFFGFVTVGIIVLGFLFNMVGIK